MNEEETKLNYITPAIEKAGWQKSQIRMEYYINSGEIVVRDNKAIREKPKKADYVLFYKENIPLAVVEAKSEEKFEGEGISQAKDYARKLGVRFAFSSNGKTFVAYDMNLGTEKVIAMDDFPSPQTLYEIRYGEDIKNYPNFERAINQPYCASQGTSTPRYYQTIAINKTVEAIAKGQDKILLVLATGTGKTYVAFQIIWRLWKAGLKKRILYLADRNILVDQTMIGDFKPFKNAMYKVEHKKMDTSYEIYLSLYQQLSENGEEDTLVQLKESFNPDFFDLIIVDECHRGSAREDSNWRKILDYFSSASKIGMTATPKETKEVSNIDYFGAPIYVYSLKDGIEDGYLAPYKVIRYAISTDVYGYRPEEGKTDKEGNLVEDREYGIKDFDKEIVIEERTKLVAEKITEYLRSTDRFAKTIVFCEDIEHAERMKRELVNLNSDLCAQDDRYVMRITGDNEEGKKQLENFIDNNSRFPTIVTTSKLLTTGVNCPMCKNIVLDYKPGENGMIEFKQIIGRGTRIVENQKMFFTILDFRGATTLFNDENFNGPPFQCVDYDFNSKKIFLKPIKKDDDNEVIEVENKEHTLHKKIYVDGVEVDLLGERIQYYGKDGKLVTESLKDYSRRNMLSEYATLDDFRQLWTSDVKKSDIIKALEGEGICINELRDLYPADVDDFDLICDVAYGIKPLTKSERVKNRKVDEVLNQYSGACRKVLEALLDKYANNEIYDITDERVLKLSDFQNEFGGPIKISHLFHGKAGYKNAVQQVQQALYS